MIIKFDERQEEEFKSFKGGEKSFFAKMYNDELNRILTGTLKPDATIGLHTHTSNSEIIYILKGRGKVLYEGVYEQIKEGQCHYCKKGSEHSLINDSSEDLEFFAVICEQ